MAAATRVQLPSVGVDLVYVDRFDATRAHITSTGPAPYALVDGDTLILDTDVSTGIVVTFNDIDFDDISAATADEVAAAITAALAAYDTTAVVSGGYVVIQRVTYGATHTVAVAGGTCSFARVRSTMHAPFELVDGTTLEVATTTTPSTVITFNTGDFADIGAATAAEVAAVIAAALAAAAANSTAGSGVSVNEVFIQSTTTGATSSISVLGGSASEALGLLGTTPGDIGFRSRAVFSGTNTTAQRVPINLYPEPEEVEVPVDAVLDISLFDTDGLLAPSAGIVIYVDGVVALTGGTFQTGFLGAGSAITLVDAATRRVRIQPDNPFDSAALTTIRVVSGPVDETWSFVVADTTAPRLIDAVATGTQTIRVTFDEVVAPDTVVLNQWSFTTTSTYAVTVAATSVTRVSATVYDIGTDIPLTFGAAYTVVAGPSIEDAYGNAMAAAPNNSVAFAAFNPSVPAGRRFQLWDFIPEFNKISDSTRDLYRFIHLLQEPTNLLLHEIDGFADLLDPDLAPEDVVDAMLADLGNPFHIDFSLTDKRRLLGVLLEIYRLKGTAPGIIGAIQFLLQRTVTIDAIQDTGWILGDSELGYDNPLGASGGRALYSYDIVSGVTLTDEERARIRTIAEYMQPAQDHLVRIVEPDTEVDDFVIDHAEIGYSELGHNFILH